MKTTFRHPEHLLTPYGLRVTGTCCEPELMDQSLIEADPVARAERGDFVVLFFDPEKLRPGAMQLRVKRLVFGVPQRWWSDPERYTGNIQPVVIVEQLNPWRQFYIRPDLLLGYHKVVGPLDPARANWEQMAQPAGRA